MTTELTRPRPTSRRPPPVAVPSSSSPRALLPSQPGRDVLPLAALLALVVFFSVRAEAFLTAANLTLISGQAGILLLASLGATLVIVAGSVDLSVGSIALLTGAVVASLINERFQQSVPGAAHRDCGGRGHRPAQRRGVRLRAGAVVHRHARHAVAVRRDRADRPAGQHDQLHQPGHP